MKNQLIQIYLLVCNIYDNQSCLKYQRLSNFKPKFSDEEIDLTASREITNELPEGINLFGDKAYADKDFKEELRDRQIQLFTPIRKPKKEELSKVQRKYDKMVSKIRQPIEKFLQMVDR